MTKAHAHVAGGGAHSDDRYEHAETLDTCDETFVESRVGANVRIEVNTSDDGVAGEIADSADQDWLEYAKCTPLGTQPADACSFARRPSSAS